MAMKVFLGIDWGGTYIKAGIVSAKGKLIDSKVFSSAQLSRKFVFVEKIKSLITYFDKFDIVAVGVGVPGIVDVKKGFIYYLPNIPGWEDYPLRDILKSQLSLPVYINNDANLFALAEASIGAGRGADRVIFLTLGTGLGGAVVLGGRILEGATSSAELGHVPITLNGKDCGCGGQGCIETFTGSNYLLSRYQKLTKSKIKLTEVRQIFLKAKQKDAAALKVWNEFSCALGMYLAGLINIFNPEKIVLGGGVAGAISVFKPMLMNTIKAQAMQPQMIGLQIVKARLKDAGLIGAALLAQQRSKDETVYRHR